MLREEAEEQVKELGGYIDNLLAEFRAQPDQIRSLVAELGPAAQGRPQQPGPWSPHQVVVHVVATDEEALLPRLRRIQLEERPELPNWDGARWMEKHYDPSVELPALMARWREEREERARALSAAESADWNRVGLHPGQGERTLLWWLEYAVAHAKEHREQLAEANSN